LNDDITSVSQRPVKTSDIPRRWISCLSAKQCELFAKHNSGKLNSNHSTGNKTVHEINDYRISPTCPIAATTPPHSNPQPHRLSLILCYSVCVLRFQLYTYVNHRNVCIVGTVEVWVRPNWTNKIQVNSLHNIVVAYFTFLVIAQAA
jgi:hypothetical protein